MERSPHDVPTAAQLVESVREWLQNDVMASTSGRLQFHSRVAINVLSMVERELALGARHAIDHAVRLAELGVTSDDELASAIREGSLDHRMLDVVAAVRAAVVDKLSVANPAYLLEDDQTS
jgi:hypothetical protein